MASLLFGLLRQADIRSLLGLSNRGDCCIIPIVRGLSSAVECLLAKEKVKGSNPLARSRRRSQVVRQGSAKALFVGSIPTVAFWTHSTNLRASHRMPVCFRRRALVLVTTRAEPGAVAKQADAVDLKSSARKSVWVQIPPAPFLNRSTSPMAVGEV